MEKRELLHTIDGTKNEHCHYGKHMEVLEKIKVELPYDPAPHYWIYPKEIKSVCWTDACTLIFLETLFTIATCKIKLSVNQWINVQRKDDI